MFSKFPLSMESIPRSSGFLCLSLKFGCVLTALIHIVYSTLGLAVCAAGLEDLNFSPDRTLRLAFIVISSIDHGISFILAFFLILGAFKESVQCIRPWILYTTFQVLAYSSIFVVTTTLQLCDHEAESSFYILLVQFLILSVMIYMLVLVVNFYKELAERKDEKNGKQYIADRNQIMYVQV